MVETLYETAAKAYFSAVGSAEYKKRVDFVEKQLLDYAVERWKELTSDLPLEKVEFDLATGTVRGSNEKLLSSTLATRLRSKALRLELQMWQTNVAGQHRGVAIVSAPAENEDARAAARVDAVNLEHADTVDSLKSGSDATPKRVEHPRDGDSAGATESNTSGQTKPVTSANRTEADRQAWVIGTAGVPTGKPPKGTFLNNPEIQKWLKNSLNYYLIRFRLLRLSEPARKRRSRFANANSQKNGGCGPACIRGTTSPT